MSAFFDKKLLWLATQREHCKLVTTFRHSYTCTTFQEICNTTAIQQQYPTTQKEAHVPWQRAQEDKGYEMWTTQQFITCTRVENFRYGL